MVEKAGAGARRIVATITEAQRADLREQLCALRAALVGRLVQRIDGGDPAARPLPIRTISVGLPLCIATTGLAAKTWIRLFL